DRPYAWISNEEIICTVLPESEKPWGMTIEQDAPQKAWQGSQAANRGEEVTVSVLRSGVDVDLEKRDLKKTIVINMVNSSTKTILESNTQDYIISPDQNWLACLETVDIRHPQADLPLNLELAFRYAVKLIFLPNQEQKRLEVSKDVLASSLYWSSHGEKLAFVGYAQERNCPPQIYIYDCQDGTVETYSSKKLNAAPLVRNTPRLLWTAEGKLLVYAAQTEKAQPSPQDRYDWWLLASEEEELCLTAAMKTPPTELLAEVGSESFVGLAEGNLWRIRSDKPNGMASLRLAVENITTELEAKLTAIVYPSNSRRGDTQVVLTKQEFAKIIVSTDIEEQTEFYQIDLVESTWKLLDKPATKAQVVAYATQTDTVIFTAKDDTGTYLWSCRNSQTDCLLEINTFLREIKPGQLRQIDYTSLNGETLKAQLILPPDYDPELTYPLITKVYPGWVISPTISPSHELNFLSPFNFHLAAARDYVV
ncbi:MAG: hypothetical protein ACRC80_23095, partial [Waterburya sp.]